MSERRKYGPVRFPGIIYLVAKEGASSYIDGVYEYKVNAVGYHNEEYLRKESLLKWAEGKLAEYEQKTEDFGDPVFWGQRNAFLQVVEKLKSL